MDILENITEHETTFEHLGEECGVVGIAASKRENVAALAYYALYALQHRGQQSAGIAVNDDGVINAHCDEGLVNEVFDGNSLAKLGMGSMAVGHVRYSTTGYEKRINCQPLVVNHIKGTMAIAHNGNLVNDAELREELELAGSIFHTTTDTEVIAYTITKGGRIARNGQDKGCLFTRYHVAQKAYCRARSARVPSALHRRTVRRRLLLCFRNMRA